MPHYWWKDFLDRNDRWQGLELIVRDSEKAQTLEMLSGHHGRMALNVRGETLFWATVLNDYSGVWLVFNADHPDQQNLLPPVTSQDIETILRKGREAWTREWCRYFARQLMEVPSPLLPARRWLMRPMEQVKDSAPYSLKKPFTPENWHFRSPASADKMGCDWMLYAEDMADLTQPEKVKMVDWWWGGNLLLGRYAVDADAGRLKWWRKKCREGQLPPILVWYIAGLASFVILDGHYRFQAAREEGIPPEFLVISELNEQVFTPDPEKQERILRSLEHQQRKKPGFNVDSMNQTLINLYDNRYLHASTSSRAVLGSGEGWTQEVSDYLRRHQLEANLENILNREE